MGEYFIFVVAGKSDRKDFFLTKTKFFKESRIGFWGLDSNTPNILLLNKNDKFVIYVGGKNNHVFVANGEIQGPVFKTLEVSRKDFSGNNFWDLHPLGVPIYKLKYFNKSKPVKSIIDNLDFIKNKSCYGAYFMSGIIRISKKDYETIVN